MLSPADEAAAKRAAVRAQVMAGAAAGKPPEAALASPVGAPAAAAPAPVVDVAADSGEPPALVAARKAEQQMRRQVAQARAEMEADFETKLSGWRPRMDKAEQVEKLLAQAQQDPIAFLRGVGFSDSHFGALSRLLYGETPEGKKDPRYKQAGEKQLAESKLSTELEDLKKKFTERELSDKQAVEQREAQARLDSYADGIVREVGESAPLLKLGLATNAKAVRGMMLAVASELYEASGSTPELREPPAAKDVIAEYERRRTAQLEALRPEYDALVARRAPVQPAVEAAPAAQLQNPPAANGAPVRLSRAELIAGIEKLKSAART